MKRGAKVLYGGRRKTGGLRIASHAAFRNPDGGDVLVVANPGPESRSGFTSPEILSNSRRRRIRCTRWSGHNGTLNIESAISSGVDSLHREAKTHGFKNRGQTSKLRISILG